MSRPLPPDLLGHQEISHLAIDSQDPFDTLVVKDRGRTHCHGIVNVMVLWRFTNPPDLGSHRT